MAVWLRTVAVRLAPRSGSPANVVTVADSLGVKPTLLCTNTLYSYVVNLKGCFLKGYYYTLYISLLQKTKHIIVFFLTKYRISFKIYKFLSPCALKNKIIFLILPTQRHIFCNSGAFTKVSGKIFY